MSITNKKQLNTSQIIDGHSQSARMNDNIGTLISLAKQLQKYCLSSFVATHAVPIFRLTALKVPT